jgi:hypothetical protein
MGTRAVKLIYDEDLFKTNPAIEQIVMLSNHVVPELLSLLAPVKYDQLENVITQQITARLVGRQA